MKNLNKLILPLALIAGLGAANVASAQSTKAEEKEAARQMTPDAGPKAEYARKVKEIKAAHRDNLANCKSGAKAERASCIKEANQIMKSDLADAKQGRSSGQMSGASGTTGEQMTGDQAKENQTQK